SLWWLLVRARLDGPSPTAIAVPLAIALGWGMLWAFVPELSARRLNPPPAGQAGVILTVLFGSIALLALPSVRRFFRTARLELLVAIGPWRIVYGGALLSIGTQGGLPAGFFWSVALGDIAVGIWAIVILARGAVSTRHLAIWNVAGMIDLAHALALGAVHLRPFFLANADVPPLNLLPLAGVPVFLAVHVMTLWGLWARRAR
ncbi:MAG: hypothetical protein NBV67_06035, partial [Tagaea sp.]|nr:hypothetical protein [Tagaea sp.]